MSEKTYGGVIVPLVTPFSNDGRIDKVSLSKIVQYVVKNNCDPFVLGTTGESASIDSADFITVAETMVDAAAENSKTYAGISSNNWKTSIKLARQYKDIGVDAVVAHPPYYYPITVEKILRYYQDLAEASPLPLFIYNIPATTHLSIPLEVVDQLSHHPNIVGIKDSERDLERLKKSLEMWSARTDFSHLLGWGAELCNALLMGSDGIVPSTGNITPHLYNMMYTQVRTGNKEQAIKLHTLTDRFSQIYQKGRLLSDSLTALKVMLNELGLCGRSVLAPFQQLDDQQADIIIKEMRNLIKEVENEAFGAEIKWT